jgi:hypothetical protein
MDVHCSTCNEPWDACHLLNDAVFDIGLSHEEAEKWCSLPHNKRLSSRYRKEFRAAGWEFGNTVVNVVRCPSCPEGGKPDAGRVHTKAALESLLGDDVDAIASAFEDYRL